MMNVHLWHDCSLPKYFLAKIVIGINVEDNLMVINFQTILPQSINIYKNIYIILPFLQKYITCYQNHATFRSIPSHIYLFLTSSYS